MDQNGKVGIYMGELVGDLDVERFCWIVWECPMQPQVCRLADDRLENNFGFEDGERSQKT